MKFDAGYQEVLKAKDGTEFRLRLVRAGDKPLFVEGLGRCSPLTLYNRFMSVKREFSEGELRYLTEVDPVDHVGILALRGPVDGGVESGEHLCGVARAVRYRHRADAADFGLIVSDEYQGVGLGRRMLERLAEACQERGIRYLCGEMYAANSAMFHLVDTFPKPTEWLLMGSVATLEMDLEG